MRKFVIIGLLFFIAFASCIIYLLHSATSELNVTDTKYKKEIGEKFILEKDTLLITDYSILKSTFTLSNGKEVSSEIVFKQRKK